MSGDNSFLGGSLLGQRWFLRMFDASSVSHIKWRLFRSFRSKCGTENWLYYTTLTNLALSSIGRPELSFDFGCWTRGGVIFGICSVIGYNVGMKRRLIGCFFCQLALPLCKTTFSLVYNRSSMTHWSCEKIHSELILAYAEANLAVSVVKF